MALFLIPFAAAEISYPVSELGNCSSQKECNAFCDKPENAESCLDFAEQNNLMSEEEITEARKILPYVLSKETPGECSSKKECEEYCSKEENLEECISFGIKTGKITEQEAEIIRKTQGKGPGGCQGERECDNYCSKEENFEKCIDFAESNGLITKQEAEQARKTGGEGPGGCRGKEECEGYCEKKENYIDCAEFAYEQGLISKEEYEIAIKTQGEGPGGCENEEECNEYCKTHEEECERFAAEHGLAPEGEKPPEEQSKQDEHELQEDSLNISLEDNATETNEEECAYSCLKEKGVNPEICTGTSEISEEEENACDSCIAECFGQDLANCLNEREWEEIKKPGGLKDECESRGKFYYLEPVKQEAPGHPDGKCTIEVKCVDHSDEHEEPEKGEMLDEKLKNESISEDDFSKELPDDPMKDKPEPDEEKTLDENKELPED